MTVTIIGAGLAGVEAAHALSRNGIKVRLCEMKPKRKSPAHKHDGFAELVCSNSLKADRLTTAAGLLKAEMRVLGSLTLEAAELTRVPAGGALAVDRTAFSDEITRRIKSDPNIEVVSGEVTEFPKENTIIATGPLTCDKLADAVKEKCGGFLSFFDAAAPIVTAESIDMEKAFIASRYGKGEPDYLNCLFTKEEYERFYHELINAESAPLHDFDKPNFYEGCMPVEVLAKRGADTLRFGCMKPVGLTDPNTGKRPWAVIQLRKENTASTMYNLVGFQTNLRFPEQKRVFSLIPGLENAEFVRYGVMHRNTFIDSPKLLDNTFRLKGSNNIYFAGQITGVEGYMESAASGIVSALHLISHLKGEANATVFPPTTMVGALSNYISTPNDNFQPMGANMGILPPLHEKIKGKQERYEKLSEKALSDLRRVIQT
jgi:methylenetetrahydrofolate--tRNA-(uracil-5-)-methyltransferase